MNKNKNKGIIIVQTLVFGAVSVVIMGALLSWAASGVKAGKMAYNKEQAFQTAEAGIDYYRWHLAHTPTDYQDGTGLSGPYVHQLYDKDGNTIGEFSLEIIPPITGSTLVKITSTGIAEAAAGVERTISSRVAKPSIAKYSIAGNNAMRFGEGTEVYGPIHINGGIRFDGLAHNIITSGATTYNDADHTGNNEIGVHTHVKVPPLTGIDNTYRPDEANPNNIPNRPDIFEAGRLISQPIINFSGFTADLAILKSLAQSTDGFYRGASGSGYVGYYIVLNTNDTFTLYKVINWSSLGNCYTQSPNNSSWSISNLITQTTLQGTYAFPQNGIIFIEDNVLIKGQINGARLTVVAATLPVPSNPSNYKNIIINDDILYTNYDGTDSLGFIGQGGIMVGMISDTDLRIDGALIAQNKLVGRFYYGGGSCSHKYKNSLTLFGMIASYDRYGFAYTDGTGYNTRDITYDTALLYAPPPSFPLTSDQYEILSWQEEI